MQEYFGGPAFLTWQRMGNIRKWAGPLPQHFIDEQFQLGKQIVTRMRELGIKTILPAFSGHIPQGIRTKFPSASIIQSESWNDFPSDLTQNYFLEPNDPLYVQIGQVVTEKFIQAFGTDNFYNGDQFNEMNPASNETAYLKSAGQAMIDSLTRADASAVWVMQGWLFFYSRDFWQDAQIEAYLSGVRNQQMLILDLYSETFPAWNITNSYYGKPFIWNELHDFGGNYGMYGQMPNVMKGPFSAMSSINSTMQGVGITMEGINQNMIVYDLLLDIPYMNGIQDVSGWVSYYLIYRYGNYEENTQLAWQTLLTSVYSYNGTDRRSVTKSIMEMKPSFNNSRNGFQPTIPYYQFADLKSAWLELVSIPARSEFAHIETYMYDVVDLTRQVMSDMFYYYYMRLPDLFASRDAAGFQAISNILLSIISKQDTLLLSNKNFLLDNWLKSASDIAENTIESQQLFQFNAKNQVTMWGPNGEITDYASKSWGGLYSQYYLQRWTQFFVSINNNLATYPAIEWNQIEFDNQLLLWESGWNRKFQSEFNVNEQGDTFKIIAEIQAQYQHHFEQCCIRLQN